MYATKINLDKKGDILKEWKSYEIKSLIKMNYKFDNSYLDSYYITKDINLNEELTAPQRRLAEGFLYTQAFMLSAIYVLWLMPESVTNWDKDQISSESISDQWTKHIQEGPVWDKDSFTINYIGHPVVGSWYYTAARGYGISWEGSFLYSAFLSTFIWEYGYEAVAEIPSWQDLFSTPIIGSLMGEGFYIIEKKINKNEGKVLGSKILGNISYFILNPIGNISKGLSDFFDIHATFHLQTYHPSFLDTQRKDILLENKPVMAHQQNYGFVVEIQY